MVERDNKRDMCVTARWRGVELGGREMHQESECILNDKRIIKEILYENQRHRVAREYENRKKRMSVVTRCRIFLLIKHLSQDRPAR